MQEELLNIETLETEVVEEVTETEVVEEVTETEVVEEVTETETVYVTETIDTSQLETLIVQNTEQLILQNEIASHIYTAQLFSIGVIASLVVTILLYKFIRLFF